jgi:hypothetical protein
MDRVLTFQEKPESLFCAERYLLDRLAVFEHLYAAKSGMLGGHLVVASRGPQYLEKSLFVCACNARGLGRRVVHSNLHAGDHRALLVLDCSVNSPSCILSRRQGWRSITTNENSNIRESFTAISVFKNLSHLQFCRPNGHAKRGQGDGHFRGYQLSYAPPTVSVSTWFSQRLSAPPVGR